MNHRAALAALHQTNDWHKSSYSQGQNACVEITNNVPGWIGIRDSKLGVDSPILAFTTAEWSALLAGFCAGEMAG